jgi:type VII secretion protein EccB
MSHVYSLKGNGVMRTRREQVQAYRFVTRRIGSALLTGEPETTELPMRRLGLAVLASVMLGTIVLAGIGVYGAVRPGGGKPVDNSIVIERETGARYVYVKQQLHPVLNYASARLVIGAPTPTVVTLSRNSLRNIPRGEPVGIPNAPDALPEPSSLRGLPWSTCSMRRAPGSTTLAAHVLVGDHPDGGSPLGGDALLVAGGTSGDAPRYLVWNSHRLRVYNNAVLAALEIAAAIPVPVDQAVLNSIPAGPDLQAGYVDQAGAVGATVNGAAGKIGQVYRSGDQYYLLLNRGLVTIGETMAKLLLANGDPVIQIPATAVGAVQNTHRFEPDNFPGAVPRLRNAATEPAMVCATYRGTDSPDGSAMVELFPRPDDRLVQASANLPSAQVGSAGIRLADRVLVPGGQGALVRVLPAPDAPATGTTRYLITDQGIKYALPSDEADKVQQNLGYPDVTPTPVPSYLLALIPAGPALDPRAASQFLPRTDATPASPSPSTGAGGTNP